MEEIILKAITSYIIPITGLFAVKNLSGKNFVLFNIKNILLIFLLASITFLLYQEQYSFIVPFVLFIVATFIYKFLFDLSFVESIIYSGSFMIFMFIIELILSFFVIPFTSIDTVRRDPILFLIMNIVIGTVIVLTTKIPIIKISTKKLANRLNKNKIIKTTGFISIAILAICVIYYIIYNNYKWNK